MNNAKSITETARGEAEDAAIERFFVPACVADGVCSWPAPPSEAAALRYLEARGWVRLDLARKPEATGDALAYLARVADVPAEEVRALVVRDFGDAAAQSD